MTSSRGGHLKREFMNIVKETLLTLINLMSVNTERECTRKIEK